MTQTAMATLENDGAQDTPLLRVRGLTKLYGNIVGCQNVSFDLFPGEVLGVVGESGSGKTTLLNCTSARLQPTEGTVAYNVRERGLTNIYDMLESERRFLLRTDWGIVYQDAMEGLRPRVTAGANVGERLIALGKRHYGTLREEGVEWFERVEMDVGRIDDMPKTFSGGMRQRLQIARNLVTKPRLVFMDEPTSGLDVSVQARLLDLIRGLVSRQHIACVIVTHDLGVVADICDRVAVMYAGRIVEKADCVDLFARPQHPYTLGLVDSVPRWDEQQGATLATIEGQPPDLTDLPRGCSFQPRCPYAEPQCAETMPTLEEAIHGGHAACCIDMDAHRKGVST